MSRDPATIDPGTPAPIDIRRLAWTSRLSRDYAFDPARVAPFFAGHPAAPEAWRNPLQAATRATGRRDRIADVVSAQQQRRAAPQQAREATARLKDPRGVAIVTGQQAALFGGPLYTLLKAITAIRLAADVHDRYGVPAVPVFWIDAEDHDWEEVRSCYLLGSDDERVTVSLEELHGAGRLPVGALSLDAGGVRALETLQRHLPATDFTATLLQTLGSAYAEGVWHGRGLRVWLEATLGPYGLVVFDPSDPDAKALVADVLADEIAHAPRTTRLAAEAGARLEQRGYRAQVTPTDGSAALFRVREAREPVLVRGDVCLVGEREEPREALRQAALAAPASFSPGVLLRPIVQDSLFPTACYVAGPGELGYLAQLKEVYDAFGVLLPLVYPRLSVTLLDSNALRFLSRSDMTLDALQARDDAALNRLLASQIPAAITAAFQDAEDGISGQMGRLAEVVPALDPTLEGSVRSTLGRMQDDLRKLQNKTVQAAKRKDETLRRQFRHAQAQAFPDGVPQERALSGVYFLNRAGPALVDRLLDLPLDLGTHWLVGL
ncbi:MAG: bacillithiol biosynthesis cysteine-adding enzyme BshC [Acidimicrobiia bacterium]|nr:bacillithiol biosynthesis cysteine-adding enzyme BshC [Acidimicrobiia bacterium]